jgi:hypothetical protein
MGEIRALQFPLRYRQRRTVRMRSTRHFSGGKDRAYLIGAMFTADYAKKAEHLAASCERFGLPYVMHEVPVIHRSISSSGSETSPFTKPNFIRDLLTTHGKPILYVDADCEIVSEPDLIDRLVDSGFDFAIYNWLADHNTDSFMPLKIPAKANKPPVMNRFFRFRTSVDWYSTTQLMCSGCVQLYGQSSAAAFLLSEWQKTILEFPGCADDECLSFAFNNLGTADREALKVSWLPKAYARIAYWIYEKPVINHKEHPSIAPFKRIDDPAGRKSIYESRVEKRNVARLFPTDCIIDTEKRLLCKFFEGALVPVQVIKQTFWT